MHRLTQCKRLVAAWMRRCQVWCMRPEDAVNQFKTCVMPSLEYGVAIWGSGLYESSIWSQIEAFWRSIARCILGVSLRAPNASVYGELGWFLKTYTFWTRATEMPSDSVVRQAMYVQREMVIKGHTCWLASLKDTLCSRSTYGAQIWKKWWDDPNFNISCVRVKELSSTRTCEVRWEDDCMEAFYEHAINVWIHDVTQEGAKNGEGKNKLRTYALFKREWGFEEYLNVIDNRDKRVLLSKFRMGVCPLRIETGRYEVVSREKKGLLPEDRKCLCCSLDKVEDEYHFLLQCTAYEARRQRLLRVIQECFKLSDDTIHSACVDRDEVFIKAMKCADPHVINEVSNYIWDAFIIRERLLT